MWLFGKKKKKEKEVKETSKKEIKEEPVKKGNDEIKENTVKQTKKDKTIKTEDKKEKADEKQEKIEERTEEKTEETTVQEDNSEKQKKSVYRVIFDKEDKLWKIKKDGAKRVIDSKKTKEEALERVQELSKSQDTKFVVYKKDGKFQKKANLKLKNNDEE